MNSETNYNGWANFASWNVATWATSTEFLYSIARMSDSYRQFVELVRVFSDDISREYREQYATQHNFATGTPDGIAWNARNLDRKRLDEMIREC
jgi:hypothetical protein